MIKVVCNGCTRMMFVRMPSKAYVAAAIEKGEKVGGKMSILVAVLTTALPMIPDNAIDSLPTVMQFYCPDCTGAILQRAEEMEKHGAERPGPDGSDQREGRSGAVEEPERPASTGDAR